MSHEKNEVIKFLKEKDTMSPYDQFNKAFNFYRNHPQKSRSLELSYNRLGYSEQNLKNILYDLHKMFDISEVEIVATISENIKNLGDEIVSDTSVIKMNAKSDFLNELSEKAAAVISSVTGEDYQNVREEFPFLNEDDCPDVMFVIVGKRITAFKKYQALHAKLQEVNEGKHPDFTEDQKLHLTKEVEAAYSENRLCWDELKHYDTNKTFLGKHPVFFESNIKNEIELMTNEELINFKNSSVKYFADQRKQLLKHAGNQEKLDIVNKRIADREFKLSLVNAKLGVSQDGKK